MYLIAISTVLGEITVHEGVAQRAAEFVGGITSNRLLALLAINVFLLFVGMLLDSLPALVIASTVLFPVVRELGVLLLQQYCCSGSTRLGRVTRIAHWCGHPAY